MNNFKIVLTNGMYIIHKTVKHYADINQYSAVSESDSPSRLFVDGQLFDKDGNGPLNEGFLDLYEHSILVVFKINANANAY